MSTPATTNNWLAPIKPGFIEAVRRSAAKVQMNPDELAQEMYGQPLASLTVEQGLHLMNAIDKEARRQQPPKPSTLTPGRCVECGAFVAAGGVECRACHEGISPDSYTRAMKGIFLTEPGPPPGRWGIR
jgi:hypothetical protein